jgi:DNA-binding Lrp family transcriptional regulator
MAATAADSSTEMDGLEHRLIQALQIDGRMPFSRIASALGVSEQTIARRYRRLCDAGVVRVVGVANAWQSHDSLFLRIHTQPGSARPIGEALARRQDVSWVAVALGDTEVTCALHAEDMRHRQALVVERLPKVSRVVGVTSLMILHKFAHSPGERWIDGEQPLSETELEVIGHETTAVRQDDEPVVLNAEDRALIAQLEADGRRPLANLAAAIGRSESYIAKRVEALRATGALLIIVAVNMSRIGFQTTAMIWITVSPSEIDRVGTELGTHPEVTFAGAVSGPANLAVTVACRNSQDLYQYITTRLGSISAIDRIDVVVDRLIKRHGTMYGDA